jgi:hypothetical protein
VHSRLIFILIYSLTFTISLVLPLFFLFFCFVTFSHIILIIFYISFLLLHSLFASSIFLYSIYYLTLSSRHIIGKSFRLSYALRLVNVSSVFPYLLKFFLLRLTWTCCTAMDIQYGHGHTVWTWTCRMNMDMQHEHGHVSWTWTCCTDNAHLSCRLPGIPTMTTFISMYVINL